MTEDIRESLEALNEYSCKGKNLPLKTIYLLEKQLRELRERREANPLTAERVIEAVQRHVPGYINPTYFARIEDELFNERDG